MSDFASIPGGSVDPSGSTYALNADVFYNIVTGGTFIDRGAATVDGNVTINGADASGSVAFRTGAADDRIIGSDFRDTINGGAGDDSIDGGTGNNYILGGGGNDQIVSGEDSDTVDGGDGSDTILGGDGNNVITGGSGDDLLGAGSGADNISGGSGNDSIWGGAGGDTLSGGSGDDTLGGGAGDDLLLGGSGNDLFVFAPGFGGNDIIAGFNPGDHLQIAGFSSASSLSGFSVQGQPGFDPGATNRIELVGNDVKVTVGADTITIKGIAGTTPTDLLNNLSSWIKVAT